jgi:UDP-N-acetylmuramoylalanine--D-glutamate ligase
VQDGCYLQGDTVVEVVPGGEPTPLFELQDMPLPGLHNVENAMAAALLARSFGVPAKAIRKAVQGFRGLPHRLEWVGRRGGVDWYDDSKGTNLAATVRSLEGFADASVHIILGGIYKGGDLTELCETVQRKAARAYLIGQAAATFGEALAGGYAAWEHCGDLATAVQRAAAVPSAGQCVVLSPACSSFDQFANFAERGRVFKQLVRALDGLVDDRLHLASGPAAASGDAMGGGDHGA